MKRCKIERLVKKHYSGEYFDLVCDGIENSYKEEKFKIDRDTVLFALQDVLENNHLAGIVS